jgi:TatD DNase family protein
MLPSLDAHTHIAPASSNAELANSGALLAMTLSLEEAAHSLERAPALVAWGVGCHPRQARAQQTFDPSLFAELAARSAIIGEVGLDTGSRVPLELQLHNFRTLLEWTADHPRLVSIHSYRATGLVLAELNRYRIAVPVLHWWTGSAQETRQAVALGCYFSVHPAIARQSKFRMAVPPERLLVESDLGYNDPPAAIPCRIEWVEHLLAQQLNLEREQIHRLAWQNFAQIIQTTGTRHLLPAALAALVDHGQS